MNSKKYIQQMSVFMAIIAICHFATASEKPELTIDQQVQGFDLVGYNEDGSKKWEIVGESATMTGSMVHIDDLSANVFGEEVDAKLTADTGQYEQNDSQLMLQNNVIITTSDGAKLTTEELHWDAEKDFVHSEKKVKIEQENLTAKGIGGSAEPGLKTAKLNENVRVDMDPATTITCDGPLEVDYQAHVAIFRDNVIIVDKEGEIHADLVTAHFDGDTRDITEVEAEGNVVIIRGDSRSYSDKVLYNHATGKVTLLGKPKLFIVPGKDSENEFIAD